MILDTGKDRPHTRLVFITRTASVPAPTTPSTRLMRLAEYGMALINRLTAPLDADPAADPTPLIPNFLRYARAVRWAVVLAALLRGEFHLPKARPRRAPSPAENSPAPRRVRARNTAPRRADSAMNHAFRTRSIGQIVTTICRDLGINAGHAEFPAELIANTQTPAEFLQTTDLRETPGLCPGPAGGSAPRPAADFILRLPISPGCAADLRRCPSARPRDRPAIVPRWRIESAQRTARPTAK
jgi:hypothetical protein